MFAEIHKYQLTGNDKLKLEFWFHAFLLFSNIQFFDFFNFNSGSESFLSVATSSLNSLKERLINDKLREPIKVIKEYVTELSKKNQEGKENWNDKLINEKIEEFWTFLDNNQIVYNGYSIQLNFKKAKEFYEILLPRVFSGVLLKSYKWMCVPSLGLLDVWYWI